MIVLNLKTPQQEFQDAVTNFRAELAFWRVYKEYGSFRQWCIDVTRFQNARQRVRRAAQVLIELREGARITV